jgi:small multidrug resistance family-3 protein
MRLAATFALFAVTAVAEIVGCYLPFLWLRRGGSAWLLLPAAGSLAVFVFLLSLHPTVAWLMDSHRAAARIYAAYGGVYIAVALVWLWLVERQAPTSWDLAGAGLAIAGMVVIALGPHALP